MPRIPVADSAPVRTAPLPDAGFTPNANAGALGGNLGQGVSQVGRDTQQIVDRHRQEADQTWGTQQAAMASQARRDLETQAQSLHGQNALQAPDLIKKQFDDTFAKIESSATNANQKRFAQQLRDQNWAQLDGVVQTHVAREYEHYQDETTSSYLQNQLEDAGRADVATAFGDYTVEQAVANARTAVDQMAARKGWDAETKAAETEKTVTAIRTTAAENLINSGSYDDAKSYVEKIAPTIQNHERLGLENALKTKEAKVVTQSLADEIFAAHPGATIGELEAAVAADPTIQKRPEIREQTEARVAQLHAVSKEALNEESTALYNKSYATMVKYGLDAVPVTDLNRLAETNPQRHASLIALGIKEAKDIPVVTDWYRYSQLRYLAAYPQQVDQVTGKRFLEMNLADEFLKLAPSEREKMLDLQGSAAKEANKPGVSDEKLQTVRDMDEITKLTIGPLVKSLTLTNENKDRDFIVGFKRALETRVLRRQQYTKQPLGHEEIQKEADQLLVEQVSRERSPTLSIIKDALPFGFAFPDVTREKRVRNLDRRAYVNEVYSTEQIPAEALPEHVATLKRLQPQLFVPRKDPTDEAIRRELIETALVKGYNEDLVQQDQAAP